MSQPIEKKRIAIIGSGISGLSTAYHLIKYSPDVEVHLIEKNDVIGGHCQPVQTDQGLVDVGFIVCNDITYPNLLNFYKELHIPLDVTDMSFAISNPTTKPVPTSKSSEQDKEREIEKQQQLSGIDKKEDAFEWSFGNYNALPQMMKTWRFWSFVYSKWRFDRESLDFLAEHALAVQASQARTIGNDDKDSSDEAAADSSTATNDNRPTHESFHASSNQSMRLPAEAAPSPETLKLSEFCERQGYSDAFMQGWLVPFCSAVWSAPHANALDFEAHTMLAFLKNHGLLTMRPPTWYTPRGRTHVFLERIRAYFRESGRVQIHTGQTVSAITMQRGERKGETAKTNGGTKNATKKVQYHLATTPTKTQSGADTLFPPHVLFDHVVLAVNSSEVPKLMSTLAADLSEKMGLESKNDSELGGESRTLLTDDEEYIASLPLLMRDALAGLRTFSNTCYLHSDTSLMPLDKTHWASWNVYDGDVLTYWVQRLQHINGPDLFITLNPPEGWEEKNHPKIKHKWVAQHPCLDTKSADSVRFLTATLQGKQHLWFAGAWLNTGFHEDGFVSGVVAAKGLLNALSDEERQQQATTIATSITTDVTSKKSTGEATVASISTGLGDAVPLYPSHGDKFHPLVHRVTGNTRHARTIPHLHNFRYDLGMYYFSLDSPPYGFRRSDYFGDPNRELHECVRREVLKSHGCFPCGHIDMIAEVSTLWGYCFNPIVVYLCWAGTSTSSSPTATTTPNSQATSMPKSKKKGESARAFSNREHGARERVEFVVLEVTNTPWLQREVSVLDLRGRDYHCRGANTTTQKPIEIVKNLHVSPFNPVPDGDQHWRVQMRLPARVTPSTLDPFFLSIENVRTSDGSVLVYADMNLRREEGLVRSSALYGYLWPDSAINVMRIYYEAYLLNKKGCPMYTNSTFKSTKSFSFPGTYTLKMLLLFCFLYWIFVVC